VINNRLLIVRMRGLHAYQLVCSAGWQVLGSAGKKKTIITQVCGADLEHVKPLSVHNPAI